MLHLILLKVVDAASARWAQEKTLPQRRRSAAPETEKAKINLAVDTSLVAHVPGRGSFKPHDHAREPSVAALRRARVLRRVEDFEQALGDVARLLVPQPQ